VVASVERVLPGPGAKQQLRMIEEVAIDRYVHALDGQRGNAEPVGIGMVCRLVRRSLAKEQDVRHHGSTFTFEGIGRQPDRSNEIRFRGEILADGGILLVFCGRIGYVALRSFLAVSLALRRFLHHISTSPRSRTLSAPLSPSSC